MVSFSPCNSQQGSEWVCFQKCWRSALTVRCSYITACTAVALLSVFPCCNQCSPVSPMSSFNRRKTCACCGSSRKSTPPRAPVHYGTWRRRQTTSCMSSPSACLGRARWANPCASGRRRRPRLRPLRVKVKRHKEKTRRARKYEHLLSHPTYPHTGPAHFLSVSSLFNTSAVGTLPFDNILTDFV